MNKLCLLACLFVSIAGTAQTAPKVVFYGDSINIPWEADASFTANKNWIGAGFSEGSRIEQGSDYALTNFQTVINQHPAFVHLMVGYTDAETVSDAFPLFIVLSNYEYNITQMVAMAQKANIKVILGNVVYLPLPDSGISVVAFSFFNAWLDQYGRTNNIPVVNYSAVINPSSGETTTSPYIVTPAGYALMSQMAQTAIATYSLTIKGGYLNNVEMADPNLFDQGSLVGVNNVFIGSTVTFTAYATWSDGVTRPMQNLAYDWLAGIWASSNPNVMYISQQGQALAIGPGTTSISFITASGSHFSPWTMTVQSTVCEDQCVEVSKPVHTQQ